MFLSDNETEDESPVAFQCEHCSNYFVSWYEYTHTDLGKSNVIAIVDYYCYYYYFLLNFFCPEIAIYSKHLRNCGDNRKS